MNDRFHPIAYPDVIAPQTTVAASLLEPARVQPDYLAMDDTAVYAQTLPRVVVEAKPVATTKPLPPVDNLTDAELFGEGHALAVRMTFRPMTKRDSALVFRMAERLLALAVDAAGKPRLDAGASIWLDLKGAA